MNGETAQTPFPTSAESATSPGLEGETTVRRVAQKVHSAVDSLEQKIGAGSDKMVSWQQEYGDMAREQVRANPLIAVGAAFAVGFVIARLFSGR